MRILFIGDIVGKSGRQAVRQLVPALREEYSCDFCIANGENMAGGDGFTKQCLNELRDSGVDVFTAGDHVWGQKDFVKDIDSCPQILRPANFSSKQPGRGYGLFSTASGAKVAVISLIGRTFMAIPSDCPFQAADRILEELGDEPQAILVDIHAEATSEKIAMGRYLDGRVTAVIGTHTHVPTADEQIFTRGTAFQCDAGMVGARDSVLGRDIEPVLHKFTTGMPARFTLCEKGIRLHGTVITVDDSTGHATHIERVVRDLP